MKKLIRPLLQLSGFFVASIAGLQAQSATPPDETGKIKSNEVIKLEEFQVSGSEVQGYRATSSITATGLSLSLLDSPVPINIETGDFIKDLGSTRLSDALMFVPGVQNSSYESVINIQGFSGLQLFRNGFYRRQTYGTWNIDDVEVLKGAAAIFYGLLRPGGVINYNTNKPRFTGNSTQLEASFGSYDFERGGVFVNRVVSPTLAIRVGIGAQNGGAYQTNAFNRQDYQGFSVTWKPSDRQDLNIDLERIRWKFTDLRGTDLELTNKAYIGNPAAIASGLNVNDWVAKNLPSGSPILNEVIPTQFDRKGVFFLNGADTWSSQESETLDLTYHYRILPSLVYNAEWNYARDYFLELRTINNDQLPFADGSTTYRFGNYGNTRFSFNFNNKLIYKKDLFGIKNTFTLGEDYLALVQITPGLVTASGGFNNGRNSMYYHEQPSQAVLRSGTQSLIDSQTPAFYEQRRIFGNYRGYYFEDQQSMFNDSVTLLWGARDNVIGQKERDFGDPSKGGVYMLNNNSSYAGATSPQYWAPGVNGRLTSTQKPSLSTKVTPEIGAVYKITNELSAYVSYTISTQPNFSVSADGTTGKDEDDIGETFGVKSELFNGRLDGSIDYYVSTRQNVAYENTVKEQATGQNPWYLYGIEYVSKGIEADLDFVIVEGWSLKITEAHDINDKCAASPTNTPRLGAALGGVPRDQTSLWTRYDNKAGGWYVGGGMRCSSSAFVENDQNAYNGTTVVARRPGFTVFSGIAGYNFVVDHHKLALAIEITNLLDRRYREGQDAFWGPPRGITGSLRTKF